MSNITKSDIIDAIAKKGDFTKVQSGRALDAFIETVVENLCKGANVTIPSFGNFSISERAERTGRNPQTGETITIAASKSARFKVSKKLKERINKA